MTHTSSCQCPKRDFLRKKWICWWNMRLFLFLFSSTKFKFFDLLLFYFWRRRRSVCLSAKTKTSAWFCSTFNGIAKLLPQGFGGIATGNWRFDSLTNCPPARPPVCPAVCLICLFLREVSLAGSTCYFRCVFIVWIFLDFFHFYYNVSLSIHPSVHPSVHWLFTAALHRR